MNAMTELAIPKEDLKALEAMLRKIGGVSFIGLDYTSETAGERAKHVVNIGAGINQLNAIREDLKAMPSIYRRIYPEIEKYGPYLICRAYIELKKSFKASLNGTNKNADAQTGSYIYICPGLKLHAISRRLYITGRTVSKTVIVPGTYKKVNSAPLTIVKNLFRKEFASSKVRQFTLELDKIKSARTGGETLEFDMVTANE